jgi:small-conductance mechanosensitive channel
MEAFYPGIYPLSIIIFLFTALFILLFFRLIKYMIQFVRLSQHNTGLAKKYLPVVELATWIIFFTWAIQYLYNRGYLVTIVPLMIFIIIVLYLAWYILKDLIAGIVFKTSNTLAINDHITVAGVSGKVIEIGQNIMKIEHESGRIISIPYSKIAGEIIQMNFPSQSLLSHSFLFRMELIYETEQVFEIIEKLRITILSLPWASQKKEPMIIIKAEGPNDILFAITVFSLDNGYFTRIEKFLEKEFNGRVIKGDTAVKE